MGNEYQPKHSDALWLGVKEVWFIPLVVVDKHVGGR